VHAENIYPLRSPEVFLLEVCVPLDTLLTVAPLLLSGSCLSAVRLKTGMADIEVFVKPWSVNESPEDSSHSELLGFWTLSIVQYSRN
jgi:hypothetical protein